MKAVWRGLAALIAVAAVAVVTACAPAASIDIAPDTTVVDVRTPAEYAEGHLNGAVNIDVSDPGFDDAIAALDPAADYVVYCRSGNRSVVAAERMRAAGIASVQDAGGLDAAASATGLEVVR